MQGDVFLLGHHVYYKASLFMTPNRLHDRYRLTSNMIVCHVAELSSSLCADRHQSEIALGWVELTSQAEPMTCIEAGAWGVVWLLSMLRDAHYGLAQHVASSYAFD